MSEWAHWNDCLPLASVVATHDRPDTLSQMLAPQTQMPIRSTVGLAYDALRDSAQCVSDEPDSGKGPQGRDHPSQFEAGTACARAWIAMLA